MLALFKSGDRGVLTTFGAYPVMEYINVGDPYLPPVIFDYEVAQFAVGGYGDWQEKWEQEQ